MPRNLGIAVLVPALGAFPVMLVGALSVLLQRDLSFTDADLGVLVATYFASAALMGAPAGRLAERIGPLTTAHLGLACTGGSLAGISLIAESFLSLLPFLILGGIGSATAQLGVTVLVVRSVTVERQGVAFGFNKAAIPLAALVAGVSVPAVGETIGWRWAFALAILFIPIGTAALLRGDDHRIPVKEPGQHNAPTGVLLLLTAGVALAAAAGSSGAAFIVPSSVARGLTAADGGLILAIGSFVGLWIRIFAGWLADRLRKGSLIIIVVLALLGALGCVGLAISGQITTIVPFTALAFGGGWGWSGLVLLAVARTNPFAPGTAMGIVHIGLMVGAVAGPLAFGTVAHAVSYSAAWMLMAALATLGSLIILAARKSLAPRAR